MTILCLNTTVKFLQRVVYTSLLVSLLSHLSFPQTTPLGLLPSTTPPSLLSRVSVSFNLAVQCELCPHLTGPLTSICHGWNLPVLKHCAGLAFMTTFSWLSSYFSGKSSPAPLLLLQPLSFEYFKAQSWALFVWLAFMITWLGVYDHVFLTFFLLQ